MILIMGYMNAKTDIKKVGRPRKTGVIGYYKRVTQQEKDAMDAYLEAVRQGCVEIMRKDVKAILCGREPEAAPLPAVLTHSRPLVATGVPNQPMEVEKLRKDKDDLWETVGKLTNEVVELKEDLERARNETLDERAAYWKGEALKWKDLAYKAQSDYSQ